MENDKLKNQVKDLQKIVIQYQNMRGIGSVVSGGEKVEQEDLIKLKNML